MRSVGLSFRRRNPERRSRPVTTRSTLLAAVLSLAPLTACGGGAGAADGGLGNGGGGGGGGGAAFQGDGAQTPSWGGWAWGNVPAEAVVAAGFDWFETGYPADDMRGVNETLANGGVRPFAYINLGELHADL